MCHLCRKVQTLGGLDYKATKPIFLAVAKLHKNIAPHLGDLWLLRHGRTAKLRKMLSSLYKVVPASALEGIIAVVDKEMEHIKRQMSEHPPSHSTGRWEDLQGSITPSESASGQMRKRKKLEGKKGSRNDEEKSKKTIPRPNKNEMTPQSPPELSGSDSDPPAAIMQQSARLVEAWLRDCDLAMAHGDGRETDSMVSRLGGGIVTRPKVDVPIWRRLSIKSIVKPNSSRSRNNNKGANTPDFVYEKPSQTVDLESDILEEFNENREKASKGQIMARLRKLLSRRKAQKTDGESNADTDESTRARHPLQEDYEDWELFMAGGRSSGVRSASIQGIAPNSRRGSSTVERSTQGEAATSLSDINNNFRQTDLAPKHHNPFDSTISTMSSDLSSRSSNLNIGSLIEQPISLFELRDREKRETQREKSPDTFVPTAPEPLQQQLHRSSTTPRKLRRKPSFELFRPSTPKPLEQAYDSPPQWTHSLRRVPTMTALQSPSGFVKEEMQVGGERQGVSMFAANRERRQADRMSNGTGEFGRPEGQSAKVYEGVDDFTKNRERRRTERQSAGPVLEKKGAGEAKTSGGEKKGARAPRGFNVEEQEVASGAAWERRVKKAQETSKKSVSEKYRAEERRKYWTSPK